MNDNELLAAFEQELPIITRMINEYISSNPVLAKNNMQVANLQLVTKLEHNFPELVKANKKEIVESVMLALENEPECKICVDNATGTTKVCVVGNVCPPGFH